jgi:hypothetical protein
MITIPQARGENALSLAHGQDTHYIPDAEHPSAPSHIHLLEDS